MAIFRPTTLLLAISLLASAACTNFGDIAPHRAASFTLTFSRGLDGFDVLIVVDKNVALDPLLQSMAAESGMLAVDADGLGEPMSSLPPGEKAFTLRIGVITSDLGAGNYTVPDCSPGGDDGRLQQSASCPTAGYDFIEVTNGAITSPPLGVSFASALDCLVRDQAARAGCAYRQPLGAVQRALDNPANAGFFRDNAGLAIVLMTTEDDCSASDTTLFDPNDTALASLPRFRCFEEGIGCLEAHRDPGVHNDCRELPATGLYNSGEIAAAIQTALHPRPVIVTSVSGPPSPVSVQVIGGEPDLLPSCNSATVSGRPAIRVDTFLSHFNVEDTNPVSICSPDFQVILGNLRDRMAANLAYRCMPAQPYDFDGAAPGVQAQCTVWDVVNPGQVDESRTQISSCAQTGGAPPCWEIAEASVCSSRYRMALRRWSEPVGNVEVRADCQVVAD